MAIIQAGLRVSLGTLSRWLFMPALFCFWCTASGAATIASQDFGSTPVGSPTTQSIPIAGLTGSNAKFSLEYSRDYSLGTCTPGGNGCALAVTFEPTNAGIRQDAVIVKDASGQVVQEILLHGVGIGPRPVFLPGLATLKAAMAGQMPGPFGSIPMAVLPGGEPIIFSNGIFSRFDPKTNQLSAISGTPSASNLGLVSAIATDGSGSIYYVNGAWELHRWDQSTLTDATIATNFYVSAMLVDPLGAIYYTQQNQVLKIAPNSQTAIVVAGNGTRGFAGDGGSAVQAELASPAGIAVDIAGNLYIADSNNGRVRRVDTSGVITTIAGTGAIQNTGDGGSALDAGLYFPTFLGVDPAGDLYISTFLGQLRMVTASTGLISTVAGGSPPAGSATQPNPFLAAGFSGSVQALTISGRIALDSDGNLWASIGGTTQGGLYEISTTAYPLKFPFSTAGQVQTQSVTLLNGGTGDLNQPAIASSDPNDFSATSNCPGALAPGTMCTVTVNFQAGGNATPTGTVTVTDNASAPQQLITVSGASGGFAPAMQQFPAVVVGAASAQAQVVSVQFPGSASGATAVLAYGKEFTLSNLSCSGTGTVSCSANVTFAPLYPGLRSDSIQFLDASGKVIYRCLLSGMGEGPQWLVDPGTVGQIAVPDGVTLAAIDVAGNLYGIYGLTYGTGTQVYRFDRQTSQWSVVAGQSSINADTGDGGLATAGTLSHVNALTLDAAGNLYIAETFCIRRIDGRSGIITTVAQQGGDSIAVASSGPMYVGSSIGGEVWKLDPTTGSMTVFAGNGQYGSNGDGGPATAASFNQIYGLAVDNNGNVLISDGYHVRKVTVSTGVISHYADSCGGSMSLDAAGDVYIGCGQIEMIPAGPGAANFTEGSVLYNINGALLRDAAGTFYTSNGTTLSPSLPSSFNMPTVTVNGTPSTASITLMDTGNAPLGINAVSLSATDDFVETNTCGSTLAPARNCTLNLTFNPLQAATFTSTLDISSTLPDLRTTITGAGVMASIEFPPNVDFGVLPINERTTDVITIRNTSIYPLSIRNVSIAGPNASDFSVQSYCPTIVFSYSTCSLYLMFQPSAAGVRTANLVISDNAAGSQQAIPLSGSGLVAQFAAGGFVLHQGESQSFAGFLLVMQGDGNLVIYQNGTALWSTGTYGQSCGSSQCFAVFQSDGNLVVYNGSRALWSSGTYGNAGAKFQFSMHLPHLRITNGGSLLWSESAVFDSGSLSLTQGAFANVNGMMLVMQGDGNLVLYQAGKALWSSGTYGQNCSGNQCIAAFQSDGNLVVYNGATPIWNSGSYGHFAGQLAFSSSAPYMKITESSSVLWSDGSGFRAGNLMIAQGRYVEAGTMTLVMQGDANLVLYRAGVPLWSSGTSGQSCETDKCVAIFQSDGNFVVYGGSTPLWSSGTYGNPGARFIFSETAPYLRILGNNQAAIWSTR